MSWEYRRAPKVASCGLPPAGSPASRVRLIQAIAARRKSRARAPHGVEGAVEKRWRVTLPFNSPQPLSSVHLLDDFDCDEAVLDEWPKRRALTNQLSGASRTFVVAAASVDADAASEHGEALTVGARRRAPINTPIYT